MNVEQTYRFEERLGILCGAAVPTRSQEKLAHDEAMAWEETDPVEAALERVGNKLQERKRDYARMKSSEQSRHPYND